MSEATGSTRRIIVMGVSGCGKTSVGERLAEALDGRFIDGDHYHSATSVEKMSRGEPLNDDDRAGWLARLAELVREGRDNRETLVIGCSALKREYREVLRDGDDALCFVHLAGTREVLLERLKARQDHFFKGEAMLDSQLATLEAPGADEAVTVDIDASLEDVVALSVQGVSRLGADHAS
ncbi:gluconate kinase (SKI family) [Chromohalobacter marismortui]|uniref:Gluconokinase n=1 Tax=Chromohalobacter marismortui TaxID=42055 RepID=A0A4R7NRR9_9GAMM|nr:MULTISPECIES: gluconokinase [Chromohalobacter]MCI0511289.1 gluconokinase [Chromohalobacter sp.]MCI0592249.1 gluconokinase [Chromohalobacter sp.]TDU23695.1 gluconate kinase (SKI family) [Chromohalobacter marismortui]